MVYRFVKFEHPGADVKSRLLTTIGASILGASAFAQSLNTYGNTGLIDMPTAEVMPDGNIAFSYGYVGNSSRATVNFQISPRVEGSIRYSDISGWSTSNQNRSDRQFDLKINILDEKTAPFSLALGFRDLLGSAIYSSEYLVATKEISPGLRVTGGLGWGTFKGKDVGVFGGIEWHPEGSPWRLKAEYSSDAYTQETGSNSFSRSSPFNVGIERTLARGLDGGIYWMGGQEIGLRLSFSADPRISRVPPDLINGPPPFTARLSTAKGGTSWTENQPLKDQLMAALVPAFEAEGLSLRSAKLEAHQARFHIANTNHDRPAKALGRAARILATGMPPSVEIFRITLVENNLPTTTLSLKRSDLETLVDTHEAVPESWARFETTNGHALSAPTWQAAPEGLSYKIGASRPKHGQRPAPRRALQL